MLLFNPERRITASEAVSHPFFQDLNQTGSSTSTTATSTPMSTGSVAATATVTSSEMEADFLAAPQAPEVDDIFF
jgi:serine/threonine protein kinase